LSGRNDLDQDVERGGAVSVVSTAAGSLLGAAGSEPAPAPAPSESKAAAPLVAGGSAADLTPIAIAVVITAFILGAAIVIGLVIGLRPRRRDRPQA
jgi:multisubunit Na+/H+ antiporter MnhC subunit